MDSRITGLLLVAERVTGGGVLQAHHGDDRPGDRGRALFALVRVHLVDLADPLLAPLDRVQHLRAGLERARVDPDVGELAQVRVRHDLEGERGERLVRVGVPLDHLVLVADRVPLDGRDVQRGRQVGDDRVQHRLHALVLEGRAAQHRGDRAGQRRPADRRDELLLGRLLAARGTSPSSRRRSRRRSRAACRATRGPRRSGRPGCRRCRTCRPCPRSSTAARASGSGR